MKLDWTALWDAAAPFAEKFSFILYDGQIESRTSVLAWGKAHQPNLH